MAAHDYFSVLLVGAGGINFGSVEGPWNHTLRLERKLGARLRVIALVDPDIQRAQLVLAAKRESPAVADAYKDTPVYATIREAAQSLTDAQNPRLVIVGAPPFARGSDKSGRDLELQISERWPSCTLLVEKPVTSGPAEGSWRVAQVLEQKTSMTVGVGYMLRYLRAVQEIKKIIQENNLVVMATNGRYVMSYEFNDKLVWWDKTRDGGPIIEQGTHFCDISRYFGGGVDLSSITVHTVEHDEKPGRLSAQRFDESIIPPENRIPRVTSASWRYHSGAVGSFMHVVALHGARYDTEFDVYADGYSLKLIDPYNSPRLAVRRPSSDETEVIVFAQDDPFLSEIEAFVDATEDPSQKHRILSTYADAVETYEFTCKIRELSDLAAQSRRNTMRVS